MANDPWVPKSGDVPFMLVEGVDWLDSSADEDIAKIDLGKEVSELTREGLESGWTRRNTTSKNANMVSLECFTKVAPGFAHPGPGPIRWAVPFQGGNTLGDRVFFGQGPGGGYSMTMAVNDWFRATYSAMTDQGFAYGYMLTAGLQVTTGAESGSPDVVLPAVAAGQKVIAAAHVVAFTGTNIIVKVQRDLAATPTDLITFTTFTAVGADYGEETTVSAETNYLFDFSGTYTTATVAVMVGIVPI